MRIKVTVWTVASVSCQLPFTFDAELVYRLSAVVSGMKEAQDKLTGDAFKRGHTGDEL